MEKIEEDKRRTEMNIKLAVGILALCLLIALGLAVVLGPKALAPTTKVATLTPVRAAVSPTRSQPSPLNPPSGLTGLPNLTGLLSNLGPLQILPGLIGMAFDPMAVVRETLWIWIVYQFWSGVILGIILDLTGKTFAPDISPRWIMAAAFGPGLIVGLLAGCFGWAAFSYYVLRRS